jgi:hypothetical protein
VGRVEEDGGRGNRLLPVVWPAALGSGLLLLVEET